MNLQEIFNKGVIGIRAQGGPSIRALADTGTDQEPHTTQTVCRYRQNLNASDSVRCMIGHNIPDEKYDSDLEGRNASSVWKTLSDSNFNAVDAEVLNDMQNAHDYAADERGDFMLNFERRIKTVAEHHNLTIPEAT